MKRGVGRPSRNRRREEGEEQKGKRSKTVKCTKCGHYGHNSRTCKGGPTAKEGKTGNPLLIKHARVRDQSNVAKAARAAAKAAKEATKASGTTQTRKRKAGVGSQASGLTATQTDQQN